MNLLRATSLYQSFRDITNTLEGSETHCEKRCVAFGVRQHLGFGAPPRALGAARSCPCPCGAVGGSGPPRWVPAQPPSPWGSRVAEFDHQGCPWAVRCWALRRGCHQAPRLPGLLRGRCFSGFGCLFLDGAFICWVWFQ